MRMPRFVLLFFVLDLALCLAYLIHALAGAPGWYLGQILHLELENNLPTWYSATQHLVVASLLGLFARANLREYGRRAWALLALPALFLFFSLDEILQIHEYVGFKTDVLLEGGDRANTAFHYTGVWGIVIGIPALAGMVALLCCLRRWFRDVPGVLTKFLLGVVVLMVGAAGMDVVANFVVVGTTGHTVEVFAEELLEMLGVSFVLWGAYELLTRHGLELRLTAVARPDLPRRTS